MLASARRVATEGTGENAPAHGFCFIAGDAAKLMEVDDDGDGVIGMIGKDRFNYVKMGLAHTVHDFDAVLFDIRTGALLGGNYRILNLAKGDLSGGTRHQAASAVAQQAGGCFGIKAGEDHCGCTQKPPPRSATLKVFDRCQMPADAPVCQWCTPQPDGGGRVRALLLLSPFIRCRACVARGRRRASNERRVALRPSFVFIFLLVSGASPGNSPGNS